MRSQHMLVACALVLLWTAQAEAAGTPAQICEVAKNKAAGKKALCLTNERAKEVKGSVPDYGKCTTKFGQAFAKAEANAAGACPSTGDADAIEKRIDGVYSSTGGIEKALAGMRFIDNGDGTVTDTQTGLMWEQKVTGSGCPNCADDTYGWWTGAGSPAPDGTVFTSFLINLNHGSPGVGDCASLVGTTESGGFAGHCDWRLPTIAELQTLIDPSAPGCSSGSPCIDPVLGPSGTYTDATSLYWSSTTAPSFPGYPGRVWVVNFRFAAPSIPGGVYNDNKTDVLSFVRAVRGAL